MFLRCVTFEYRFGRSILPPRIVQQRRNGIVSIYLHAIWNKPRLPVHSQSKDIKICTALRRRQVPNLFSYVRVLQLGT